MENSALLLHLPWEVSLRLILGASPPPNVSPAPHLLSRPWPAATASRLAVTLPHSAFTEVMGGRNDPRPLTKDLCAPSHQGLFASVLLIAGAGDLCCGFSSALCGVQQHP